MTPTQSNETSKDQISGNSTNKRCGFWGWCVRGTLVVLLLLTTFVSCTAYLLLRPSHVQATAIQALERLTQAEVTIDYAQLTWNGELFIEGLEVRAPGVAGFTGQLIRADRMTVRPEWSSLVWGEPVMRWVNVDRLQVFITEDRDNQRYAIDAWLEQFEDQDTGPAMTHLPEITLDETVVVFSYVEAGKQHRIDQFKLDASLLPDEHAESVYVFQVDPRDAAPQEQPTITGRIDLAQGEIIASLTDFMFTNDTARLLPEAIRPWWQQRQPQGHIAELDMMITHASDQAPSVAAIIKFNHAALTLPMGQLQPRLQNVHGELKLLDQKLVVEHLRGDVADLGYRVTGHIQNIYDAADSPLNVTVTTSEFDVPERLSELIPLPTAALEHYERLSPSGTYSVQTRLTRDDIGEKMRTETVINLINARMVYHGFQYPITDISGRVVINDRKVTIEQFEGVGPSGAKITAVGTINPAGKKAEVNIDMTATEVPIDDHLRDAMDEKRLKVFNQFFNSEQFQSLLAKKAIQQQNSNEQHIPVFNMGGITDLKVTLHRPEGLDQKYRNHITVNAAGLSAVMENWPYPATATSGRVDITPDGTLIRDIHLLGPTGAEAHVRGKVVYNSDEPGVTTDVEVDVQSLPIDDLLVATLRPEQAQWIKKLGFVGDIQALTKLTRQPEDDRLDFIAKGSIVSGSIQPFGQQLKLEEVRGEVELTPQQLQLSNLTAKNPRLRVTGDAGVQWQDQGPTVRADLKFHDVNFDPMVLDLMPDDLDVKKRLLKLIEKHQLTGHFDASASVRFTEDRLTYQGDLMPQRLNFKFRDQALVARDMQGRVHITEGGIEFYKVSGKIDEMNLTLDGLVLPDNPLSASMLVSAKADRIGQATRLLLPAQAVNTIEKLSFSSSYQIDQAQLHWNSPELKREGLSFQGDVHFSEAAGVIAVPFRQGHGKLAVNFTKYDDQRLPNLNLNLSMNQVLVRDRRLRELTMRVVSSDDLKTLNFERIRGNLYNGTLTGKGTVSIDSPQQFVFDLAVVNSELGPVIDPTQQLVPEMKKNQDQPVARNVDDGLLSTSLTVMGRVDTPNAYRGRGQLDITRAKLFRQPIALTLLHTVNLAMPISDSFEKVTASYTIHGQTIHIQSLTLWSPFAAVSGGGTISLQSGKVDLAMVARNPSAPNLGAIADMMHLVKDEVVGIRVDGTLDNPRSRIVSFEGVLRVWRRLFPDLFRN